MKLIYIAIWVLLTSQVSHAQSYKLDKAGFFAGEAPLNVILSMDIHSMMTKKMKVGLIFPATIKVRLSDSVEVNEKINVEVRGHFRRETCYIPPLKLNFKSAGSPTLSCLGSLKLVNVCQTARKNEEYLLKEFLTYKIYNQLTDKSLRVRLLKVSYVDAGGKKKTITEYAFLVEDIKDMALRNNCVERKRNINHTEATDRKQMTRVALFEYMIGNTDWAVPVKHNIRLIVPSEDTNAICFAVPYDFDHAGLVDADYALPDPRLPITNVKERMYRGFPRTMDELDEVLSEFKERREAIYNVIRGFDPLPSYCKKDMIIFLDQFFEMINNPSEIKLEFIQNARKN